MAVAEAIFEFAVAAGLATIAIVVYKYNETIGYSGKRPAAGMELDLRNIGVVYCIFQTVTNLVRGFEFLTDQKVILSLPFADYIISCPLIILDLGITLRLQNRALLVGTTIASLIVAVMTVSAGSGTRQWLLFATGSCLLLFLFERITTQVRQRIATVPQDALPPLYAATSIFLAFWPVFPLIFILSDAGAGLVGPTAFSIVQAILDFFCKGAMAYALTLFRMRMEDEGTFYSYTVADVAFRSEVLASLGVAGDSTALAKYKKDAVEDQAASGMARGASRKVTPVGDV